MFQSVFLGKPAPLEVHQIHRRLDRLHQGLTVVSGVFRLFSIMVAVRPQILSWGTQFSHVFHIIPSKTGKLNLSGSGDIKDNERRSGSPPPAMRHIHTHHHVSVIIVHNTNI